MMMDLVAAGLDELHERIAGRFARAEPRARVREYVSGLVTGQRRAEECSSRAHNRLPHMLGGLVCLSPANPA
jgi:hypothetical protein